MNADFPGASGLPRCRMNVPDGTDDRLANEQAK